VPLLGRGRRLERLDVHALGVEHADGAAHHAPFAGRVHPLQDQQQRAFAAGATLGEQPFLEVRQL